MLGFIVAGILVGPYSPVAPIASDDVQGLQGVAELGVVLFLFTVGLEMRPSKLWAMRRLLFGLGSAQMLITAAILGVYGVFVAGMPWESATLLGLGLAMSSTAIIMATLGERGELASEHGKASFAILMAQDFWIVPIMALIPVLAHQNAPGDASAPWQTITMVIGVIAAILVVGRYLLPALLGYCAENRRFDA